MLSPELEHTKSVIESYALKLKHEYVLTEHILWGLLTDNASVQKILSLMRIDIQLLIQKVERYLSGYVEGVKSDKVEYSLAADRVLRRATIHVQMSQQNQVEGTDVLVALLSEKQSFAAKLLGANGVIRLELLRYLSHNKYQDDDITTEYAPKAEDLPLIEYAQNLNERAKQGKIDPIIGREAEIQRVCQILSRRRKNNPLLVGDAGVGKTAVAEGMALLITEGKVPDSLKEAVIYSLDVGALLAGTKYRGDFEARIKALLSALKKEPFAILFIDEIHTAIGAGSSSESHADMSNLIKPALASGELRCIGATTFEEYRRIFEKQGALSRRFQKVDIKEPDHATAVAILTGLASEYERHHRLSYTKEALEAAVSLSVKHIHDRFLPDKAIDVIDEAGARVRLADPDGTDVLVGAEQIEEVVASIAQIAPKQVGGDKLSALKNLKDDLKRVVFGQDDAIIQLTDAILLSHAGLKRMDKPIGCFMFAGPTGVGKTEIARQLSMTLGIPLIRFDMSEYVEAHSVSRLIGSPPGYVGHDKGGLLTEKVHQTPHCVLLLDELEKAHSDIYSLLLQVMDYGKLTDTNGREVSFRQVILIMTTNVGADSISRSSMGFTHQDHSLDNAWAMKQAFAPEFRNRLDAIVQFRPLGSEAVSFVVDKFLIGLQLMLDEKSIVMTVTDSARAYLATKGYDRLMGARPMAQLIDDELKKPLAHEILFGSLVGGGTVLVDAIDNKLNIQFGG